MNTKTALIIFVLTLLLKVPALAVAMDIHQEPFTFRTDMTKDITCNTFVITEASERLPAVRCRLSMAHFELGSAVLSPGAASTILADLTKCQITPGEYLRITGHTCSLGPERLNRDLSRLRAEAVADLLRQNGFTVGEVQGAGSQCPITDVPAEMELNRRVEIDILSSTAHEDLK